MLSQARYNNEEDMIDDEDEDVGINVYSMALAKREGLYSVSVFGIHEVWGSSPRCGWLHVWPEEGSICQCLILYALTVAML